MGPYRFISLLCALWITLALPLPAAPNTVPAGVDQLLVAIAKDWDSDRALLWAFERRGNDWTPALGKAKPVMLGHAGLAWGLGVIPAPGGAKLKVEGDGRTPAGLFRIGKIYGYPRRLPRGSRYPYHQIGPRDAWIDDPANPFYNQHFVAKPGQKPDWFESQRMRLGDPAYTYRVEVRHNADPPKPGFGSAIFFHYRRGPNTASAGCTTMKQEDLHDVIRWLRASKNPHYVILPQSEYDRLQSAWKLPLFR